MIHWTVIVYGVVAMVSIIVVLVNFFSTESGGMWTSGKKKYDLDFVGWFNLFFLVVWTLIWGGKFWW